MQDIIKELIPDYKNMEDFLPNKPCNYVSDFYEVVATYPESMKLEEVQGELAKLRVMDTSEDFKNGLYVYDWMSGKFESESGNSITCGYFIHKINRPHGIAGEEWVGFKEPKDEPYKGCIVEGAFSMDGKIVDRSWLKPIRMDEKGLYVVFKGKRLRVRQNCYRSFFIAGWEHENYQVLEDCDPK